MIDYSFKHTIQERGVQNKAGSISSLSNKFLTCFEIHEHVDYMIQS